MEKTSAQTTLDEKMNELSPEKRELLELLFGGENPTSETRGETANQPLNKVETELKKIWEEVMSVGTINKTDNFFALGGDSLHCIQIVAKARKANLKFTTADLFEARTIERLAQKIGATRKTNNKEAGAENTTRFADESGLSNEDLAKFLERI